MAIRNVVTRGYGAGATIAFVVTRGYTIGPSGVPSAAVGGTTAFTEPTVVAGAQQTTITLTADTWLAAGAAFDAQRQNILDGISAAESELTGWNREVRDKEVVTAVVRTSATVVTITWSAAPDYDIALNEAITVTVPDEALITSTSPLVATPAITVTATAAVPDTHTLRFSSVSRSATFSAVQRQTKFSSASRQIVMTDTPDPLGFILDEDGGIILQEDDVPIAQE